MRTQNDPDARMLRWGWLAFAAWTVIGGVLLILSLRAGAEGSTGIAFVAPLWAAWLLWLLWRAAVNARHWVGQRAYGEWHGNYFEFDGRQVRVMFEDDDIYFAAADIFDIFGIDTRSRAPERARLMAGRDGLLELPERKLLVFSESGLRAWMQRRSDRTATRFMAWLEKEGVGPHRTRRRALGAAVDEDSAER